ALQAQGRRAFERKREIYITDFVALLKIIFSLDGNIIGCPLVPPGWCGEGRGREKLPLTRFGMAICMFWAMILPAM
ncbi:MAG: hypothetical protein PHH00_04180, partial [Candidatus Nanoarchaeia archaeon]|nr:hypothetical protein [Candidatus Nanoarchaeia archaeon]